MACVAVGLYWLKYEEWAAIPRARTFINDQLKDPSSTQFKNERITKQGWLCGELNSKNSNGGYVGFKRYISGGRNGTYSIEDHGSIGEQTFEDVTSILDKKIEFLKLFNEMKIGNPDIKLPSEDARHDMAVNQVFEDKWKRICIE